ncbi:MAG: tetratricopeptide repeat protein, partial [Anaerolineales bacterium]
MYKDADTISFLKEHLGEEAAHTSVERLLRVPPAWEALQEPEFLKRAVEGSGGQALFPSLLAALSLGAASLSDALDKGTDANEVSGSTKLQTTAKQALELCRIDRDAGASGLIEFMLGASTEWQHAFVCAWPEFSDHIPLFETVAKHPAPTLGKQIANALLAYMSAEEAAIEILAIKTSLAFQFLPWVECEPNLHKILREELIELSDVFQPDQGATVDRASNDALILSKLGRLDDAHSAIRRAWEISTAQTARVADRLAEIAKEDQDPVLEAEARQQALEADPSSLRRSLTAISLLELERYEDGLNLVREGDTFEENIASGLIYLAIQDTHTAGKKLNQAAQQAPEASPSSEDWYLRLAEGLQILGFQVQAIQVFEQLIAHQPARADLRASLAALLYSIGDIPNAIQEANIAVTLDPNDNDIHELLASAYEQRGEPETALDHWKPVAAHDVEKSIELGECALAAGKPDIAIDAANRILEIDPEHVPGLVLFGRSLTASGEHAQAKTVLTKVTERSPENADAWIALASNLQAIGEPEQAGHTLEDGLRSNPDHAGLHMARAQWLNTLGHNAEALEHTRTAVSINPANVDWQMEHAKLLNILGHHEEARDTLETIIAAEPANWKAAEQLAQTYEQLGDQEHALSVLKSAPEDLGPDSAYYVGRLLATAGSSEVDFERSSKLLTEAKANGITDSGLNYWLGVSELKQTKYQSASKHFLRYLEATKDAEQEHYLDAVVGFANAAVQIGELTLALTQLEKAKPSFPTSIELLSALSETHALAGDRRKSLDIAREALELYPDSQDALQIFKRAAEQAGEFDDAIEAQRLITSKSPDEPANWLDMARIDNQRGEILASRSALAK